MGWINCQPYISIRTFSVFLEIICDSNYIVEIIDKLGIIYIIEKGQIDEK